MGRKPCCVKDRVNRGAWSLQEDQTLSNYIQLHGEGKWRTLPQKAGLNRCGKSCRLRWMNYLRPGIKRGNISPDEDDLIIRLHRLLGNRWSLIAGRLPGRTDNEIKNYWNSVLSKRLNGVESTKLSNHKQCESVKTYRPSKVIAPKATRCTKTLIPINKQFNDHFTNSNCVASSSTPADNIDEQLVLESRKNSNLQMPNNLEDETLVDNVNALNYSEFSQSPLDDIFENCKTLETDLAPMSEMELDKLNSLLGFEDEWRYLLFQDDQ